MDKDGDGSVSWREFIEAVPLLLQQANADRGDEGADAKGGAGADIDALDAAWIELSLYADDEEKKVQQRPTAPPPGSKRKTYWYNKVERQSQWSPPTDVLIRIRARRIFEEYDRDQSGTLSASELKTGLVSGGFSDKQAAELCSLIDRTGDGDVTLTEML